MTPTYADAWLTIYGGDCREVMAGMDPDSVHCVVTSPPFWGLRDYGVTGQLGLEATPAEYVANLVDVFRSVRRVLRDDGTVWLNLGDSYASGEVGRVDGGREGRLLGQEQRPRAERRISQRTGLKPKDLVGIPWRVAFALQEDGWYLRSDIIWSKPNPMPESVTDRPTRSHEYLFLLAKSPRYFFDADAVREVASQPFGEAVATGQHKVHDPRGNGASPLTTLGTNQGAAGRNIRSVWTIATQPYPGAHFATFPQALVEPCVKAGTSERGVCSECGAPWVRVVERQGALDESRPQAVRALEIAKERGLTEAHIAAIRSSGVTDTGKARVTQTGTDKNTADVQRLAGEAKAALGGYFREFLLDRGTTTGWQPSCAHTADPVPSVVLDCFAGSGTVGLVAQRLSRRAVLIDLNPDYLKQQLERNAQTPLGLEAA